MPSKNKGSWRQFDSKKSGGDGGGTKGKTILVSIFFGLTMIFTFILLVLSFSQISERPTLYGDINFCKMNDTHKPVRFLVPVLAVPIPTPAPPTEPPTPAPTAAPEPTDAPTTAPTPTDAPTAPAKLARAELFGADSDSNDTDHDHTEKFKQWALHKNVVECPWPKSNSVFRIFTQFLGLATCICVFWLVMRREVWQAFWVCLIACIALVILNFAAFANDANTLASSRDFCQKQAVIMTNDKYYNADGKTIVCSLGPQVAVAVLNVIWLLWIPSAALLYLYVKSWKVVIYS